MALTLEQVRKIASLVRLRLFPEEERVFTDQLGDSSGGSAGAVVAGSVPFRGAEAG